MPKRGKSDAATQAEGLATTILLASPGGRCWLVGAQHWSACDNLVSVDGRCGVPGMLRGWCGCRALVQLGPPARLAAYSQKAPGGMKILLLAQRAPTEPHRPGGHAEAGAGRLLCGLLGEPWRLRRYGTFGPPSETHAIESGARFDDGSRRYAELLETQRADPRRRCRAAPRRGYPGHAPLYHICIGAEPTRSGAAEALRQHVRPNRALSVGRTHGSSQ